MEIKITDLRQAFLSHEFLCVHIYEHKMRKNCVHLGITGVRKCLLYSTLSRHVHVCQGMTRTNIKIDESDYE